MDVRHGEWEQEEVFEAKDHVEELQSACCSVCKRYLTTPYSYSFTHYNFCPNCGADMRPVKQKTKPIREHNQPYDLLHEEGGANTT